MSKMSACPFAFGDDGQELPIKQGYLNVAEQQASGFSLNRIAKKKSSNRYCLLFKASRHGIERLEICESKDDKNPKIITLENCVKITQEPAPANLIIIVKKTGSLTLNTLTDEDLKEWVNALQTVAFRDKSGGHGTHVAIEEDNDLYCSSYGDGLFIVTLIPSETSIRCNLDSRAYMLHLTATELQLKSAEDINIVIAKWPYRFIRKYGYRDKKFTFEAGRKCSTGEGVFTLDHSTPQEIFRCMSAKMKSMKKLISGDSFSSMDSGENQLSIAASMEAGSRSPLPPSPSNQQMGGEFLSSSDSLNFSINTSSPTLSAPLALPLKNIPNKPPRKLPAPVPPQPDIKTINQVSITGPAAVILKPKSPDSFQGECPPDLPVRNESIPAKAIAVGATERDYECIENITEAWKTMGIVDVKHTERNNDNTLDFNWQRSKITQKESMLPISVKSPRIIDIDIGEGRATVNSASSDATYDSLNHFAPNNETFSSYKTILNVSQQPAAKNRLGYSPVMNDYELIASPDIQACRKADDHLGYGMLRKATTGVSPLVETTSAITKTTPPHSGPNNASSPTSETPSLATTSPSLGTTSTTSTTIPPDHKSYNGLDYTIVSRPKRV